MKVVVHFGMSKAGSTALQKGLVQARRPLLERGVLYPRAPIIPHSHNLLMTGLVPEEKLPRFVRHSLQKAGMGPELYDRWMDGLGEICAREGVHTLVLSAENLWAIRDEGPGARLRARLTGLGAARIEAMAYLRRPSDWYLSIAGQILAASHAIRPAGPIPYRAPIERFADALADPGAVRLRVYDRAAFPRGDILADFLGTALDGLTLPEGDAPPREANVSLSPEGLEILRAYRLANHRDANGSFTEDTREMSRALEAAEAAVPGHGRPRLRPEIARMIDHGSPDLVWLRDARGVAFEGIDADAIGTGEWRRTFDAIDRLCPVDETRRAALTQHVLRELAGRQAADRKRRKAARRKAPAKG